ncbi:hypothetical protein [Microbacterium sp.]|uniref:hypothetical protein n=1 Tax=Microbacterium sp. TaxID=51671 RepID=UPI000C4885E9|nr:hypothetical protein [Microbacterium sp.]MBS69402.1 hypothetical protein [Pseudomonas sp.]
MGVLKLPAPQRFAAKLIVDHESVFEGSPCVLWAASATSDNGHGRFWDDVDEHGHRRSWIPRRYAWRLARGVDLPTGLFLYARCGNQRCVNDLHAQVLCARGVAGQTYRDNLVVSLTCPQGHLWTRQNRQENKPGKGFRCAKCNRLKSYEWQRRGGVGRERTMDELSPECRNGHRRTEQNTRFDSYGTTVCRDCQRDASQRWVDKQKAGAK